MAKTLAALDLPLGDNLELAAIVRKGVPARTMVALATRLGLSVAKVAPVVQMSKRTLERRIEKDAILKPDESERVVRVGRLVEMASSVFEDDTAAAEWFGRPLRCLGDRTPLELCATEPGAREVEHVLGRIEHGVFS